MLFARLVFLVAVAVVVVAEEEPVPWLGQHFVDDVIACVIRDEARRAGAPEWVAMGIAGAESNWDPDAIGDNGLSFGLFQLYTGDGQGSGYRDNPTVLLNPRLNARVAMPAIVAADAHCGPQGLALADYIACVAVNSGHPGPVSPTHWFVQAIVRRTLELIFNADGSPATWPAFQPGVCQHVVIPPPTPIPPHPEPDWSQLPPVGPPYEAVTPPHQPVSPPPSV